MENDEHDLPPTPPSALAGYTGYLLRRAFMRAAAVGGKVMPPGRHPRDVAILMTLRAIEPVSQRQLGELLSVNRTVMVKLADELEAAGLLSRERDPADRRSYALRTTAEGRAILRRMSRGAQRGEAELTAALTPAERSRLVELLSRIVPDVLAALPDQLTGWVGFLLAQAHHRVRGEGERALRELGLVPQHFGLLTTLAGLQPCSQQRLATALGVSGPAIVAPMTTLEGRGLLRRERNPADRREHLFELTSRGRAELAKATAVVDGMHRRLAEQVGRKDLAELDRLLAKLSRIAQH